MENLDVVYLLLVLSTLVVLTLGLLILKNPKKKQIHYAVLGLTVSIFIWNIAVLLYFTFRDTRWYSVVYEQLYYIGAIFASVAVLFTGLIYAKTYIKFSWKHALLFVVPLLNVVVLLTNSHHHLFYTVFSLIPSTQNEGIFFMIHTVYSYLCIGVGLVYLAVFSIKNSGFFSQQSILIFFGILLSLIFDSFSTLHIFNWSAAIENIVFAVTMICFILAIIKLDFLNIVPIALQTVVNSISDSYVVINECFEIIDYNTAFHSLFPNASRKDSIVKLITDPSIGYDEQLFTESVEKAVSRQQKITFEMQRFSAEEVTYYQTEIKPIIVRGNHIGTIILIKDITEHRNSLEQVTQLNKRLQSLATQDWLTQAYNRYYFDERLQQEIERVNKHQTYGQGVLKSVDNFGLIMFDIDHFKIYNDTNGHLAGDKLLQSIVAAVQEILFPTDILCRYGGEEFVVICCGTSADGVRIAAEKIRKTVENYEFMYQDIQPGGNLTVSIGVAYCSEPNMKKDDLIKIADNNLYRAKNNGRNKVIF